MRATKVRIKYTEVNQKCRLKRRESRGKKERGEQRQRE